MVIKLAAVLIRHSVPRTVKVFLFHPVMFSGTISTLDRRAQYTLLFGEVCSAVFYLSAARSLREDFCCCTCLFYWIIAQGLIVNPPAYIH